MEKLNFLDELYFIFKLKTFFLDKGPFNVLLILNYNNNNNPSLSYL